jgi:hypothetical protein
MGRHVFQQVWACFQVFSPRRTAAVCPKPANPATITISSGCLLPKCSSFRSEFPQKLIDNPGWCRFHEAQRLSNLHRRPEAGRQP